MIHRMLVNCLLLAAFFPLVAEENVREIEPLDTASVLQNDGSIGLYLGVGWEGRSGATLDIIINGESACSGVITDAVASEAAVEGLVLVGVFERSESYEVHVRDGDDNMLFFGALPDPGQWNREATTACVLDLLQKSEARERSICRVGFHSRLLGE